MSVAPIRPLPPRQGGAGPAAPRPGAPRTTAPRARPVRPRTTVTRTRRAADQPGLFEADPYRVERPRAPKRATPVRAAPTPQAAPVRRASIQAQAAPEHSRSLVPFVAMCVAIIVGSLVAVLLLNTTMAKGAYETRDLRSELSTLQDQRSELRAELESHASPQALAKAAKDLGMVAAPSVGYVTVKDGTVVAPGRRR